MDIWLSFTSLFLFFSISMAFSQIFELTSFLKKERIEPNNADDEKRREIVTVVLTRECQRHAVCCSSLFSVIIVLYVYLYTRECPSYENKRDDCRVKISLSTAAAIMSRRKKEKEKKNDEIYGRPCWAFVSFKEKTTTVGRCWTPKEIRLKRKLSGLFISLCSQESFTSSSLFFQVAKMELWLYPPIKIYENMESIAPFPYVYYF